MFCSISFWRFHGIFDKKYIIEMDFVLKDSVNKLNICRCCLAEGCYNDIHTEYYHSGQREVYEEMLNYTFDIQIPHTGSSGQLDKSCLICDNCVTILREACQFKRMIKRSLEAFAKILDQQTSSCNKEPIAQDRKSMVEDEFVRDEDLVDVDMRYDDRISYDDDDEESNEPILKMERNKHKAKKKFGQLMRRNREKGKLNDVSKAEKDWMKIAERRGNGPLLRENSIKLISNSTICVFQWNKSRYRCFCCMEPFSDMTLLREHTNNAHNLENIKKKIIIQQNRLVKVEVSIIYCKICGTQLDNLNCLKNHLKTHDIKFDLDEDLLVPFKINSDLQCQICDQKFTMFRLLNIHMNKHFQKQVCHICGAGFSNLVFLNLHKSRSHRPLSCKQCNLNFEDKSEKREHDITVHNLKIERKLRFPCPFCEQRFYQENIRVQHLVEKHGMSKPEHKCTLCSKVFITRSLRNNHVKKVHLKEKNQECDICHHVFYTKSDVARHKVTHTGDKKFSCTMCNNMFSTKDSLRRHLKRAHGGS